MRRAGGAGLTRLVENITTTAAKSLLLVTAVSVRVTNRRKGFRLASAQVVTASLGR
ncbi:hypothetical protein GCM10010198_31390 [Nocardia seriolae]|nr:phosphomethylpyrimidine kinase [Nocardia seriolae]